jgi:hypothetical protein
MQEAMTDHAYDLVYLDQIRLGRRRKQVLSEVCKALLSAIFRHL